MAFLLSAMMLITGAAMGTVPAAAAEKSPPDKIDSCTTAGISKGFAITFNTSDEDWFQAISSVQVAGTPYKKAGGFWDFEDTGSSYVYCRLTSRFLSVKASVILQLPASSLQTATVI